MITNLLNEVNEKIETLNNLVQDKEYFEKLDERIEKVNNYVQEQKQEIERLNKILEDIDTYINLWKIDEIGEKTMLILNDILLIKNGMSNEVIRLKGVDKE